jgi:hypothetical protein
VTICGESRMSNVFVLACSGARGDKREKSLFCFPFSTTFFCPMRLRALQTAGVATLAPVQFR